MKVKDCTACYASEAIIISLKESREKHHRYLIKFNEKTEVPFEFLNYENIVCYFCELSEDIREAEVLSIFALDKGVIEIIANKK